MTKHQQIGIRLQPETKVAIEMAAKEDMRSVSSLVEKILTEWLINNGKLHINEEKK